MGLKSFIYENMKKDTMKIVTQVTCVAHRYFTICWLLKLEPLSYSPDGNYLIYSSWSDASKSCKDLIYRIVTDSVNFF